MTDSLRGTVERVTFHNPETGFTVAKLHVKGKKDLICVVGPLPAIQPGETVRCEGRWAHHPNHGLQFQATSGQIEAPSDVLGIRRYLGSGLIKGIGPIYAERIVAEFGEKTLDVIDQEPKRLLSIPGIGKGRLRKICQCWEEQRAIRQVMVFLQSFGVSPAFAQRIFKCFGQESIAKVRANPYLLAREVRGIGFQTADALAQKLGINPLSAARVEAGIEHVLSTMSDDGHVCSPREELVELTSEMLSLDHPRVSQGVEALLGERRLVGQPMNGTPYIWKQALYLTERGIVRELERLLRSPGRLRAVDVAKAIEWVQEKLYLKLAPKQSKAVGAALGGKVLIVTGGPGTGKSTIIKAILAVLSQLTRKITLAAPTGRAAKRMTEVTGRHAQTIHALLEWDFQVGAFRRGRDAPLGSDLIVVDEASMIDTALMHGLLKAVPNHARLILVGDINQLPSVGPGNVLKDLIASKAIPVVELTDIFRQAKGSRIIINAHRINAGEFPSLKPDPRSDFFFFEEEEPEALRQTLIQLVKERIPKRYGFDPIEEIQVLAPMKRGVIGTLQLNLALQAALNPSRECLSYMGTEYRLGDKVMQIRNNYDKGIYNGDVGRITAVNPEERSLIATFDEKSVRYEPIDLEELVLAYAVSIHKYQGSECPCIIIPVHTSHFKLLHRNLLYTGVTRGKKLVVLLGTKKAIAIAVNNDEIKRRHTGLKQALLAQIPAAANH